MKSRIRLLVLLVTGLSSILVNAAAPLKPQPARNPLVRVVSVNQAKLERGSTDLLEETMARLDQAASFHPDIACLPEHFPDNPPEAVPGPVCARLSSWAREHSCYVVFGLKTTSKGRTYNSALLIDRNGQLAGQYNKLHPTEGELQGGISPGEGEPPIFETDFGSIGIQICFDVNWWDMWKRLKQKGARIVFFPSAYPADHQLSALALMNQYYVVSSAMTRSSKIYDISGEVLSSSGDYQQWAGAVLPLGKRLFEIDFHIEKMRKIQQKYGSRVEVTWFHDDDWVTMTSLDPNVTTEDIISEFGLTPLNDYRVRATGAVDKAKASLAEGTASNPGK
jgi:beta-ureidopropionase